MPLVLMDSVHTHLIKSIDSFSIPVMFCDKTLCASNSCVLVKRDNVISGHDGSA